MITHLSGEMGVVSVEYVESNSADGAIIKDIASTVGAKIGYLLGLMKRARMDRYYRCKSFPGTNGWEVRRPYGSKAQGEYHIYACGMTQDHARFVARMFNTKEAEQRKLWLAALAAKDDETNPEG